MLERLSGSLEVHIRSLTQGLLWLPLYKGAFKAEFYDHHQSCNHIADVVLQENLNNVLERMHGSIREREKVI